MRCKLGDISEITKLAGYEFTKYIKYIPDGEIIAVRALNLKNLARFVAIAADKATTMGHIKREDLAKAEVIIPDVASMERIGGVLQPIYNLVINQRIENRKLSMLRDSLLPKLMSGELDVSAIEL